jgi:hypothetical protein
LDWASYHFSHAIGWSGDDFLTVCESVIRSCAPAPHRACTSFYNLGNFYSMHEHVHALSVLPRHPAPAVAQLTRLLADSARPAPAVHLCDDMIDIQSLCCSVCRSVNECRSEPLNGALLTNTAMHVTFTAFNCIKEHGRKKAFRQFKRVHVCLGSIGRALR